MKVKIGDKIYDSTKDGPMMIIFEDNDKQNIVNMISGATKYCVYDSDTYTNEQILKWMGKL